MFSTLGTSPGGVISAVLLAAGGGERLRPLTDVVAKPALPLLDLPLGAWGAKSLGASPGFVVNVSHLAETIIEALDPEALGARVFVEHPEPYGTGGTLAALRDRVDERLLVWNADTLTDLDATELLETHERSGAAGTISVMAVPSYADFKVSDGRATELIDRRHASEAGARYIGVAVFEKRALELLPGGRPHGLTETLLRPLLERGELGVHVHERYSLDVGTIDRYLTASLDVLYERAPRPPRSIPGKVVEVSGGRSYMGPGAHADEDSLGPGAIVLANATVEPGARIEHSIVWRAERVPSGTELRDVVWFGGRALDAQTHS